MSRPARRGLSRDPRQLEPGDDHDRPRLRRCDLRRTADVGGAGGDHRTRASRRRAAHTRRPDGVERGDGAVRTGTDRRPRPPGDDRCRRRRDRHRRGSREVQGGDGRDRSRRATFGNRPRHGRGAQGRRRHRAARDHPPGVHPRWARHRDRGHAGRVRADGRQRAVVEPDRRDPRRGVDRRVEGVRARGDARSRRQLRDHLLDRERRPDGCAHRRLDHRLTAADAHRRRVPADARLGDRLHPARRCRDRRFERAVRGRTLHRTPGHHRDEPARVAFFGAGVEGNGLPDRQDRGQARRRLHARRDPQRHHREPQRRRRPPASSR